MKSKLPSTAKIGPSSLDGIQALLGEGKAKRTNPWAPYRSKTEHQYAEHLRELVFIGDIAGFQYEPVTFTLVPKSEYQRAVTYTPDFRVIRHGGEWEWHEVKGWMRPGAAHKIKSLAHIVRPIPVYVVRKENGEFTRERF